MGLWRMLGENPHWLSTAETKAETVKLAKLSSKWWKCSQARRSLPHTVEKLVQFARLPCLDESLPLLMSIFGLLYRIKNKEGNENGGGCWWHWFKCWYQIGFIVVKWKRWKLICHITQLHQQLMEGWVWQIVIGFHIFQFFLGGLSAQQPFSWKIWLFFFPICTNAKKLRTVGVFLFLDIFTM